MTIGPMFSGLAMTGAMLCQAVTMALGVSPQGPAAVETIADIYLGSAALVFLASVCSARRGGVDFLVSFFFLFLIAVPAQVQLNIGVFPWLADLSLRHLALSFALLAFCQLCYATGQSVSLRRPVVPPQDTVLTVEAAQYYTKWAWGLAGFALFCALAAGPENLMVARQERQDDGFDGITQQLLFAARAVSLLSVVLMIYLARFCPFPRLRQQSLWALLLFLPVFLVINYPPALARFVLFGAMIALSCLYVDYTRPRVKFIMTGLAVVFLFFVFPFTKLLASGAFDLAQFLSLVGTTDLSFYLVRADVDGFMQITSAVEYLDEGVGGLRWGYNFLGVLLFFVPRALWPDKPIHTGELVSNSLGYWFTNVASPLPAEAVMSFGLLGPILVFLPLGYVISRLELSAGFPARGTPNIARFALYAITMGFIIIILRGALNGVAPQFASGFLAYAVMVLVRRNRIVWRMA